jgi:glycosyltransferase involved in cell wall biosynthesis
LSETLKTKDAEPEVAVTTLEVKSISIRWRALGAIGAGLNRLARYLQSVSSRFQVLGDPVVRSFSRIIVESTVFDTTFYLEHNPDVAGSGMEPPAHYIVVGAARGRDPHPLFDTDWYLANNPDVVAAGINPLVHYLHYGTAQGRDPNPLFDTDWYLVNNPDVAAAGINPLVHYLHHGTAQGRDPNPLFDTDWYLATNPDVAAAGINPLLHYLYYGAAEGRDPNPFFDTDWYLATNPDVAKEGPNPLVHYLRHGATERRDPHPSFDTDWYLANNPDVVAAGINPLVHYLHRGAAQGRDPHPQRIRAIVAEAYEELKNIEPLLQQVPLGQFTKMRVITADQCKPAYHSASRRFLLSLEHSYERIAFIPCLTCDGTDQAAIHALRAAQERHGVNSVLLLVTDHDQIPAKHWLPDHTHMRRLSEFDAGLSREDRMHLVKTIIHSLQPKAVLNVNSRACWDVFARYGAPISYSTQLYAMMSCYDYTSDGRMRGYAVEYFRDCLPHLTRIYSDNAAFCNELCRRYGVPARYLSRFATLYQPWVTPRRSEDLEVFPPPPKDGRFRVFWAGRICRQKNPELLLDIARRCPEYMFDVYGICEPQYEEMMTTMAPPNVNLMGPFRSFEAIPAHAYDACLYTSLWDGVPDVLVKVATVDIPVVASGLPAIVELIDETTGWPIMNYELAEGYIKALEEILTDTQTAESKIENLRERVTTRHSWNSYVTSFLESPSFLD